MAETASAESVVDPDVEREQHPEHGVADGREADGPDDEADVAQP